ncbi:Prophage CP4-57 regulatory protein (AlpA) [Paraburkholderia fungorum]|uniref:Prophage CP4-57 regulatory protein (AlpA) n=1 Tax=Paraburkholderia fungorum TaxID=134537 RepID=A0A1H1AWP8_9BURK|nr:AlpA family phage regulatory protein [Paraburkholderia fungorum]SDQ43586.1 Prophage CP4-57 regulatory protein (AlpA) [Paraburkholderia fungorum]
MADQTIPIRIPRYRVSQITGLQRSALYERIARGEFPKPVAIDSAAVRSIEAEAEVEVEVEAEVEVEVEVEVVAWVQQQIDTSRKHAARGKSDERRKPA